MAKYSRAMWAAYGAFGCTFMLLAMADEPARRFVDSPYLQPDMSKTHEQSAAPQAETMDWGKQAVSRSIGQLGDRPDLSEDLTISFKNGQLAYFFGRYEEARRHWIPLAERGFAEAQANVGWLYQAGLGGKQDYSVAQQWYRRAAAQQQPVAQNNLGTLYELGLSVNKDLGEATRWYLLSAENGYRYGQYNLGLAYLEGKGVPVDKEKASLWLRRALTAGVAEAGEKLKLIP